MSQISALNTPRRDHGAPHIIVFNRATKVLWTAIVIITVISELMPIPLIPPVPFYAYKAAKAICFVGLGFFAPLAFWRFNALNRGILFAAISATCVESLQGLLHQGHSFHWYELLAKLTLIVLGFALALNARYEKKITIRSICIHLVHNNPD